MKRMLRRFGFAVALVAAIALSSHNSHTHTARVDKSSHSCALCNTPTVGSFLVSVDLLPHVFVSDVALLTKFIFSETSLFASTSPRAPPIA